MNALACGEGMLWRSIMHLWKDDIRLQIVYKEQRIPISLSYLGTLADEAALKAINDFKGAGGIKFCMEPSLFQRHTMALTHCVFCIGFCAYNILSFALYYNTYCLSCGFTRQLLRTSQYPT